jgi:t-SNARE complex subunit (syntaxin)
MFSFSLKSAVEKGEQTKIKKNYRFCTGIIVIIIIIIIIIIIASVRKNSNSNKLPNQTQQFYKFIT